MDEAHLLVHLHPEGPPRNIPNLSCASMIELKGHTAVHGTVHLKIHIVPDLEGTEVGCQWNVTCLPETSFEKITGSRTQTVTLHVPPCLEGGNPVMDTGKRRRNR